MTATPTELYVFGSRAGPRRPRLMLDVFPDANGMVGPEHPPLPRGPSAFADLSYALLTGHWHVLPKGTLLPEGVEVVADGIDAHAGSPLPATHHTIYPAVRMPMAQFIALFMGLPWHYGGKK